MQVTNYFYILSTKHDFCHVFGGVKNCKLQSLQNVQNKKRPKIGAFNSGLSARHSCRDYL